MRLVVTRPQADSERSATALRARGHQVLVAPLMRVEPVMADCAGGWGAIIVTSANAPGALAADPARAALLKLPVFAVGRRSADAARQAGFSDVSAAGGDVRDLVRLIAERRADASGPLLYLAGEDRAADLIGELSVHGIAAEMRIVYRAVTTPFPPELIAALKNGEIDAVLHFSRRSADNYLAGARAAGLLAQALAPRHVCLSAAIADPLTGAGATGIVIAARPDEAALLDLVDASRP
ncbi:MAG TPA: uroporphyrinogen-III synthase [Pseudolabrys sp.]